MNGKGSAVVSKNALKTLLILVLATGCSLLVSFLGVGNESIIMVFLLGVLFTTVLTGSYGWGIGVALVSVILFNYLFTEPRFTFLIYSPNDLMLLVFFLVTAIVSGTVTSRLRREIELAGHNERTARTLYMIASGFLSATGREGLVKKGEDFVREYAGTDCRVILATQPQAEPGCAAYDIISASGKLGALFVRANASEEQQELIIHAVCTQLGIALERENLVAERENIRIAMERERQRGMLLRSVAHDLRSPLTALSGAGNLLADSYEQLTDAERRKLASDVSEEIVWLTDLVENILNMTRIGEGQLLLQKQDEVVDDVVSEAVSHTERLLRGRKLSVCLPDRVVTAPMDGKLIAQVIINLLENAARHTPPESQIVLKVDLGKGKLLISVIDTGEGVPPAIRSRLFERFVTQYNGIADGRRGLGLGLAICRAIVEAHGGTIWVADNQPRGSVFTFTLPMEVEE